MSHHLQVPNMASIFFYLESRVSVVQLVPNLALAMLSQVFFGSAMDNRFVQIASFSVWTYVANQILSREHDPWPPMADQEENQLYSVRVYVHFLSCFRLLDIQQR